MATNPHEKTRTCGASPNGRADLGPFVFFVWVRGQKNSEPPLARRLENYTTRSTSIFFTSAMALAGLRPFGQTWAQFMIVWQR